MLSLIPCGSQFGSGLAVLNDIDGDNVKDLAVGAYQDQGGGIPGSARGAVWILFMRPDGTVDGRFKKITDGQNGFTGRLDDGDFFGFKVAAADVDGDGIDDLSVGAYKDDDGDTDRGALWFLMLDDSGTVRCHHKLSDTRGGLPFSLSDSDYFGSSTASVGDLDGDGVVDFVVGARQHDATNVNPGALYVLFLRSPFENYGVGTAGTGGVVPRITGTGCPIPDETAFIDVTDGFGNASGALFVGIAKFNFPIGGGTILVAPFVPPVPITLDASGNWSLTLSMPGTIQPGAVLYWQTVFIDFGAPSALSFTDGLEMTIFTK